MREFDSRSIEPIDKAPPIPPVGAVVLAGSLLAPACVTSLEVGWVGASCQLLSACIHPHVHGGEGENEGFCTLAIFAAGAYAPLTPLLLWCCEGFYMLRISKE